MTTKDYLNFSYCLLYYNYGVFFIPTIIILKKKLFKNSNNSWMFYKCPFESFINLSSSVHIIIILKIMQKECIKWSNWLQIFCTWKTSFFLCNYMFINSISWINKSYENFKVLKLCKKGLQGKWLFIKSFG
jgi:hypothetical protein